MKKLKSIIMILSFIITATVSYSQDYTKEDLEELKQANLINQETYDILMAELGLGDFQDENIYTLNVNGTTLSKNYSVMSLGGEKYFSLIDFINKLDIKNYENIENIFTVEIGESLKKVEINNKNKTVSVNKSNLDIDFEKNVKYIENEIYISLELLKILFVKDIRIDENYSRISMDLNFNSPAMIEKLRRKAEIEIENSKENPANKLVYTNERKLFELGNLGVETYVEYEKKEEDKSSETKYVAEFEYQGSLLYGELKTRYNTYDNEIGDTYLTYKDILAEDHELKIGSYNIGDKKREWGIRLNKNRGYFQSGKNYIIEYDVPIGSKVELLYYGIPIEIQDAYNGQVRFENPAIKEDRTYQLRITSVDGKIEIVDIKTSPIYNNQNKGEFEYDFEIREEDESGKVRSNGEIYYGLTDKLTLGTGFSREIEEVNNEYKYIDSANLELTYSDYISKKYPYVFQVGIDKTLSSGKDNSGYAYDDRYNIDLLYQIDIDKFRIITDYTNYGKYYSEKQDASFDLSYDVTSNLRLGYRYENTKYRRENENESNSYGTIEYDYNIGKVLFSNTIGLSEDKDENYIDFNIYMTSWYSNTISLENRWTGKKNEYEGTLTLYNGNLFSGFDYSFSLGYSEKDRERLTLEFELDLANIFTFEADFGNKGSRRYKAGIDTVIDLRNTKTLKDIKPINSLDSTNVKTKVFIDENGNNLYEEGEELLKNVEVSIAGQKKNSDENGEAIFYGVPSNSEIEVGTLIRRPSYTMGNTSVNIHSKGTSSVVAYIPVKPMMTLQGILELDNNLDLTTEEKRDLYDNIVIQVQDKNGKIIESTLADENGIFIVSGLFTEEYIIQAEYTGTKFNIQGMKEAIKIAYTKDSIQDIKLAMLGNRISLNKK